jgi:hypothetical protein
VESETSDTGAGATPSPTTAVSRPHALTLAISIVALVISCASWYESHQARRFNELISRPVLEVGIKLRTTWVAGKGALPLNVIVSNVGKSVAKPGPAEIASSVRYHTRDDKQRYIQSPIIYSLTLDNNMDPVLPQAIRSMFRCMKTTRRKQDLQIYLTVCRVRVKGTWRVSFSYKKTEFA